MNIPYEDLANPKYLKRGAPLYRLTEAAYIDDILLEEGQEIHYAGVPGHYMEAVDDAAVKMKKEHPSRYVDPILEIELLISKPEGEA